jgi:hypothetical protein
MIGVMRDRLRCRIKCEMGIRRPRIKFRRDGEEKRERMQALVALIVSAEIKKRDSLE